jgi:hypothetical protein
MGMYESGRHLGFRLADLYIGIYSRALSGLIVRHAFE